MSFSAEDRAEFENMMTLIRRMETLLKIMADIGQLPAPLPKTPDLGRYFAKHMDVFAELRAAFNLDATDATLWDLLLPHVIGIQLETLT